MSSLPPSRISFSGLAHLNAKSRTVSSDLAHLNAKSRIASFDSAHLNAESSFSSLDSAHLNAQSRSVSSKKAHLNANARTKNQNKAHLIATKNKAHLIATTNISPHHHQNISHMAFLNAQQSSSSSSSSFTSIIPTLITTAVSTKPNTLISLQTMLDTGSTANFITQQTLDSMDIKCHPIMDTVEFELATLNESRVFDTKIVQIYLITPAQKRIQIEAYVIKHIAIIPALDINIQQKYKMKLNEHFPRKEKNIQLLLGCPDTLKILNAGIHDKDQDVTLLSTPWGYVPAGRANMQQAESHIYEHYSAMTQTQRLADLCELNWAAEELPFDNVSETLSKDELSAVLKIDQLLHYHADIQRFSVGLLFRNIPNLINNYSSAAARLDSMLRKLQLNSKHAQMYNDAFLKYKEEKIIEKVEDPRARERERTDVYYMPHRAIIKEQRQSTKCRIVFDCSQRTNTKLSLNDHIMPGPSLHTNLIGIQLRFRFYKYCASSDVQSMFTQIIMRTADRDYLRFLWKDPTKKGPENKAEIYRFTTVLFGLRDAPFTAMTALQKIAKIHMQKDDLSSIEQKACQVILHDFYVDDLITGSSNEKELIDLTQAINSILKKAHFTLKKWASNSSVFLNTIPQEDRSTAVAVQFSSPNTSAGSTSYTATSATEGGEGTLSQLGYTWQPRTDTILFQPYCKLSAYNRNTKTCVARLLAMVFDLLGIVSPFILLARQILKRTFQLEMGWKDTLPNELMGPWNEWVQDTNNLSKIAIPRYVENNDSTTLHLFSDASINGLGLVAYARTKVNGKWKVSFVMAKSKSSPKKENTVPRLELTAALLTARVAQFLHEQVKIPKDRISIYSDSLVTLYWLTKNPDDLITYVANRIKIIQQLGFKFYYCSTSTNPADHSSRGLTVNQLLTTNWFTGPDFLTKDVSDWPAETIDFTKINSSDGLKKQAVLAAVALEIAMLPSSHFHDNSPPPLTPLHEYKGRYYSLLRVTARILLYIKLMRNSTSTQEKITRAQLYQKRKIIATAEAANPRGNLEENISERKYIKKLDTTLMRTAKYYWIHTIQQEFYAQDMQRLSNGQHVHRDSKLLSLNPTVKKMYGYDILCAQGRIYDKNLPTQLIILPKQSKFTALLINNIHHVYDHASVDWIHYHLRQEYWIIHSKQTITKQYRQCFTCKKVNAKAFQQIMAPMHEARFSSQRPFTYTGLDHTGYIDVKISKYSQETSKHYIVLYCCMSTRNIQLELVEGYDTEQFLMSLIRLQADRSMPKVLISDNHQTYKASHEIISNTLHMAKERTETDERFQAEEFKWIYSSSYLASTGGSWESLVKSVKQPLSKVLPKAALTYVELNTIIKKIQGQLNDRPLCSASDDTLEVITPNHLFSGHKNNNVLNIEPENIPPTKELLRERWKHRNLVSKQVWNAWQKQYLCQLQQRAKWFTKHPDISEGDLVLVETQLIKRNKWPVARVISVKRNRYDNAVRSVQLWLGVDGTTNKPKKFIVRSIRQLYPLECTHERAEIRARNGNQE